MRALPGIAALASGVLASNVLAIAVLAIAVLAGAALPMAAAPLAAQDGPRAAILGDTIRVGDVVPVAVRLVLAADQRVVWPDTLPTGEDIENVARVRERVDTLEDGRLRVTAVYSVTPWRTGDLTQPDLDLQVVTGSERVRTLTAAIPAMSVVSVLPADTAGIDPMPARGVIGRSWALWPIIVALLALLAVIAGVIWWRRRRGAATVAVPLEPPVPPRERALARLQHARDRGLVEAGDMKPFYTEISEALREYLAAVAPAWGEDLTTTELIGRFRAQVGPEHARALALVLRPADQVKFARREPDHETALREWDAARSWVVEFHWPPRPAESHGEAA